MRVKVAIVVEAKKLVLALVSSRSEDSAWHRNAEQQVSEFLSITAECSSEVDRHRPVCLLSRRGSTVHKVFSVLSNNLLITQQKQL